MLSSDRCVYYQWSTGTGKTVAAIGAIQGRDYELCLMVVKPNNLIETQRKLLKHADLPSIVYHGTPQQRKRFVVEIDDLIDAKMRPIVILNAEKFREDTELFIELVEDRDLLVIFDEMPTKYGNRATQLYRKTSEVFYTSYSVPSNGKMRGKKVFYPHKSKDRPRKVFYIAMSATPIVSSPENVFNCVRMMDSSIFGSINDWNNNFVGPRDRFGNIRYYRNLDLMRQMVLPITHQADKKNDPFIAAQFPEKLPAETIFCDLDSKTAKLYDTLQQEYRNIGKVSILTFREILAAIGAFQMLCSNPRSILKSAEIREEYELDLIEFEQWMNDENIPKIERKALRKAFDQKYKEGSAVALKLRRLVNDDSKFTDEDAKGNCIVSKMTTLKDLIDEHEGKCIVFTSMHETLQPLISEWFDRWNITHVCYPDGGQSAIDMWRNNPDIKVFLSTDAGADSIDLPESDLTIHYDLPWTWASVIQRENRQDRIDSRMDTIRTITLAVPATVEDRKAEIIDKKRAYHEAVYGDQPSDEEEDITEDDYMYILTGER